MRTLRRAIHILIAVSIIVPASAVLFAGDASAIPAFARRHKVACSTCHLAAPKLKAYGEEYAANGFVLPEGEEEKREYIDTGDDMLLLHRSLPLAVRFDAYARGGDTDDVDLDMQTPYGVKLLSGGRVTKSVSYYFYFYMSERGEVAGLEDAYLHFNDIGGSNFDLMAGQFQVSDPLFKRELRLTFEDYWIYTVAPGQSSADLTYDRGIMMTYGMDFGLDLVGEVVNGNGIGEAEDRVFDLDTQKAYALRLSQSAGPVRVGGFGYYTQEEDDDGITNEVWYAGGDATLGFEKLEVNVQYLHREDDNPWFAPTAELEEPIEIDGGLAEVTLLPRGDRSRWIVTALYNLVDSDNDLYDLERATLSLSHMAALNLRILLEGTYDVDLEDALFTVGAMAAF